MRYRNATFAITAGLLLFAILGTAACSSGTSSSTTPKTTTPSSTSTSSSGVSFSRDIQPIFNANCVVCHTGTSGPQGLSLDPGSSYKNLVNVKSTEAPSLNRVSPSAADKSYILNKLLGTQTQAGGSGAQMPFGATPLPQSTVSLIQQWISAGAPNN
jgi:hypothetical protein